MRLIASKTAGSRLTIGSLDYGTTGGFSVAYTPGAGGDGTAALGILAQQYSGLDVGGTINGRAATGSGQILAGAKGDASESVFIKYTGATARAAGPLAFSLGVGGKLASISDGIAADNSGTAATLSSAATTQASDLGTRIAAIQTRLDARKAQLTAQFIAMESAMSKAQSLGSYLTSQMNALQAQGK